MQKMGGHCNKETSATSKADFLPHSSSDKLSKQNARTAHFNFLNGTFYNANTVYLICSKKIPLKCLPSHFELTLSKRCLMLPRWDEALEHPPEIILSPWCMMLIKPTLKSGITSGVLARAYYGWPKVPVGKRPVWLHSVPNTQPSGLYGTPSPLWPAVAGG